MQEINNIDCKYCNSAVMHIDSEGLQCKDCFQNVHISCLSRQSVPGGLAGDIFFTFTCKECSTTGNEIFERDKMTWLQAISIALYHMQTKSPGLARKGYFHWKLHIAAFIDKYWDILFRKDFKRKKKWTGTISGSLSNYSPLFFKSGTSTFNEQGWWTLTYPRLTPNVIFQTNAKMMAEKQKTKEGRKFAGDADMLHQILISENYMSESEIEAVVTTKIEAQTSSDKYTGKSTSQSKNGAKSTSGKRFHAKTLLPTLENYQEMPYKKYLRLELPESSQNSYNSPVNDGSSSNTSDTGGADEIFPPKPAKLLDPYCHYNTSLKNLSHLKGEPLKTKLLGGVREDLIVSPYSGLYLKPYIRRDVASFPGWLQLMAEVQLKAHKNVSDYVLPARAPIDFTYMQPEHVPAINSLCNQFFWPGIDLTECLQYPDFSCVVLYRKLIVGFAFLVPDVKISENYLSFLFTRPGWRNVGIGRFMVYHLIQTSIGKDITLHVSINNPALFLYQKFGFKVEHVALDFYDKYIRSDAYESKHAFFCRLER